MVQMKNSGEIGVFIKSRMNLLGLKAIQVAEELANAKGRDNYNKNQLRDLVYKWINGERTPGIDYVYYLSKILKVSIEELLVAGEVCEKYENRPYTLYAVAKSGNIEQLEKIMNTYTPDGTCVGENYDEYDKTILDYIIEFENVDLLHYLIDNNYMHFDFNQVITTIRIGGQCSFADMYEKLVRLAIKYDDLKLFKKLLCRIVPIFRNPANQEVNCFTKTLYNRGYMLSNETILLILDTREIFKYLCSPFVANEEEWKKANQGVIYKDGNDAIKGIHRLSASFNNILDLAHKYNHNKLSELEKIAISHNKKTMQELSDYYPSNDYKIAEDGVVYPGRIGIGCLTILGVLNGKTLGE
ncbi:MAG: helix-turn-helix transcriptional regulator [Clostridia bacterium]|nr:helix-turn-helix transcriptional regulator [Clostridia bacterium]